MCNHCGNLTSDYDECESCHRMLPDEPKYYCPRGQPAKISPKTTVVASTANTVVYTLTPVQTKVKGLINKGKFYGTKTLQVVQKPAAKRPAPVRKLTGRRKIMKKVSEPGKMCY